VRRILLAATLAAATAIAVPIAAISATDSGADPAQGAPQGDEHPGMGHWMGHGMHGRDGAGMRPWPMMMRHMMGENPQQRCIDRLAWRAARRAYVEVKLDLTAEQRPLWEKVQSTAQAEEQKERQLCDALKADASTTLLDRMDRLQQFLSVRLDGLQSAKPAVQALYQALTPEQRAIVDHPFPRP
jgi:hypothetical protein